MDIQYIYFIPELGFCLVVYTGNSTEEVPMENVFGYIQKLSQASATAITALAWNKSNYTYKGKVYLASRIL